MVTEPQPSWAAATPVTFVRVSPGHSRTRFAGSVSAGAVVSRRVMLCTQLLVFPQPSVAFQVRVMTPVLPQPGAKASVWLIVTAPQVSLPVAEPCVAGVVSPVHSTVLSEGTVRLGLVVSTTVIF